MNERPPRPFGIFGEPEITPPEQVRAEVEAIRRLLAAARVMVTVSAEVEEPPF